MNPFTHLPSGDERGNHPAVPTGELDDTATIMTLLGGDPWAGTMPACEGECGNIAERAHFDATAQRFIALCIECEPIPFTLADGDGE